MGKPGKKASNIFQNPGIKNNTCNSLPFVKGIGSPLNYGMPQRGVGKALSDLKDNLGEGENQIDPNSKFGKMVASSVAKKRKCKKKNY